jgi:glycosyltransferase involved in cell wall biosynthesis
MTRPRFSVVIPTRERATTLRFTLQTCLAQEFHDYEIVVSDNSSSPPTRQLVEEMADERIRYVRTPRPLAMSDSWDFALSHAHGEYVTVIGDDDGLLLHALREIDRLIHMLGAKALRWETVCYNWPDMPAQQYAFPHELLIPMNQIDYYHPIVLHRAKPRMQAASTCAISYAELPTLYHAAIHSSLIAELRNRTGSLFRSQCPDIYSGFALAYLADTYHSVAAPMNISGLSGRSNGVACLYLKGRSPIAEEFYRFNSRANYTFHPSVPSLPVMPAHVADSFQHAKDAVFPHERDLELDRRGLIERCLRATMVVDENDWQTALDLVRQALGEDKALRAWFEAEYGSRPRTAFEPVAPRPTLKRYGGTYLHLDASEFGISDVWGAAQFCERLLGYGRDGINAHLVPVAPASGQAAAPGVSPLRHGLMSLLRSRGRARS